MNKRSFIKKAILGIASLEVGFLVFDVFKSKPKRNLCSNWFLAGRIDDYERNMLYPFNSGKFYLSIMEDGGVLAISIICTHLGCIVQAVNDEFLCPCHASAFNKYGEVLSPPATRALDVFPVVIDNGEILVNINDTIKRKGFDKSQLAYAT
ncbi:MAG: Rieske (2Fe-2S) protein [Bacteroidetes bacterium]|nr:MAG: Rieske (2Fe-2S) protein [Bacteroidota bacterium]